MKKWIYIRRASQNQKLIGLKEKLQFLLSVTIWTLQTGYLIKVGHLIEVQYKFGRNGSQYIFIASIIITKLMHMNILYVKIFAKN